jgi:hypothetical protein
MEMNRSLMTGVSKAMRSMSGGVDDEFKDAFVGVVTDEIDNILSSYPLKREEVEEKGGAKYASVVKGTTTPVRSDDFSNNDLYEHSRMLNPLLSPPHFSRSIPLTSSTPITASSLLKAAEVLQSPLLFFYIITLSFVKGVKDIQACEKQRRKMEEMGGGGGSGSGGGGGGSGGHARMTGLLSTLLLTLYHSIYLESYEDCELLVLLRQICGRSPRAKGGEVVQVGGIRKGCKVVIEEVRDMIWYIRYVQRTMKEKEVEFERSKGKEVEEEKEKERRRVEERLREKEDLIALEKEKDLLSKRLKTAGQPGGAVITGREKERSRQRLKLIELEIVREKERMERERQVWEEEKERRQKEWEQEKEEVLGKVTSEVLVGVVKQDEKRAGVAKDEKTVVVVKEAGETGGLGSTTTSPNSSIITTTSSLSKKKKVILKESVELKKKDKSVVAAAETPAASAILSFLMPYPENSGRWESFYSEQLFSKLLISFAHAIIESFMFN